MSIFDKLKQGVNDAGQKAKAAVEQNRIKAQIQASQKQIEEKQTFIGGIVYRQYEHEHDSTSSLPPAVETACQEIAQLQVEIKELDRKLKELNNEKDCTCGKVVPLDTKFCPFCGHPFAKLPEIIEVTLRESPSSETSEIVKAEVENKET
ncbi:zinc ribbon domain-containing protein [Brevibacillus fluminis]|uniref:Zinc ribbon domain-containing protein n=1 Tax=Brevibacillus fluminis TaxID=511487 RepID=A0A3M8DZL1_9BACL|nr:zinc ribbon domain-containing protein [Brevibacillus fluminis]RNB92427.1 zinc ribbon domain-containing protein [Brevibacillus fluminis]